MRGIIGVIARKRGGGGGLEPPPVDEGFNLLFTGGDTSEKELGFFAQVQDPDDLTWETVGTLEMAEPLEVGEEISILVPGFEANKEFTTRLAAYNASGISQNSPEFQSATQPNVPISNLTLEATNWDTVEARWDEPAEEDRPVLGGYEIFISRDNGVSFETWPELAESGSGGIDLIGVSEGLETLKIKVRPVVTSSNGNFGQAWSETVSVDVPEHILNIDEWALNFGDAFVQGYAMNEPVGATEAADDLGLRPGTYSGPPTLGATGFGGMPGETAMQITSGQHMVAGTNSLGCGLGQAEFTSKYACMLAFRTTSTALGRRILSASGSGSTGFGFQIRASSIVGTRPKLVLFNSVATEIASVEAPAHINMSDGLDHTVGMQYDAGRLSLWFDGVEIGFTTITEEQFGDSYVFVRFRVGAQAHGSVGTSWIAMTASRLKVFIDALSPEDWAAAHYKYHNPVPVI